MSEKAKRIYLYSVMAMTLMPAPFLVNWTNIANLNDTVLGISAVLGYMGVVFMLHMSLIGIRTVATIFLMTKRRYLECTSGLVNTAPC